MLAMILSPLHNKSRLEKANANIFSGKANLMIFASAVAFLMEIRVYFAIVLEILLRSHSVPRVSSSGAVAVITILRKLNKARDSQMFDVQMKCERKAGENKANLGGNEFQIFKTLFVATFNFFFFEKLRV